MDAMSRRWPTDCAGLTGPSGLDPVETDATRADLLRRWSQPHRRYHDATHLHEVLAAVDVLAGTGGVPEDDRAVALVGAWFHDAVYDVTTPGSNEMRSADLARTALRRMGAPEATTERVATVILDTADHDLSAGATADPAGPVLHDADLWVLAAPLHRFDEYCAQVREEYGHVPSAAYAQERSQVLRPLLGRRHLYATAHARARWNEPARENLARELIRLAG
ncbi:MAG: HD domain-containing protein [Dermatophilaceae bacterium]